MSDKSALPSLHHETPIIDSSPLRKRVGTNVFLKMDSSQQTGSFKLRGIGHICVCAVHLRGVKHLISSSGGNAGLAVAYAARVLGVPATIVIPTSTHSIMKEKMELEGAQVIVHGSEWRFAHERAIELAKEEFCEYIPPFNHPEIWEGHSTIILESAQQLKTKPKAIITAVGGGGLMCGILEGMHKVGWNDVPLIACETLGADSFAQAVAKGELITLPAITSIAKTLGANRVAPQAFEWTKKHKIIPYVVTDKQAVESIELFQFDHQALVEPACGAALAFVYFNAKEELKLTLNDSILVIVCGGSAVNIELIKQWKEILNIVS